MANQQRTLTESTFLFLSQAETPVGKQVSHQSYLCRRLGWVLWTIGGRICLLVITVVLRDKERVGQW